MKYSNLTPEQKKSIEANLNQAKNMRDFLAYLNLVFDLENCVPGSTTKKVISASMVNVVLPMINPEIK